MRTYFWKLMAMVAEPNIQAFTTKSGFTACLRLDVDMEQAMLILHQVLM